MVRIDELVPIVVDRVSVPFRGSCSEISRRLNVPTRGTLFPSPFGVRVLKCDRYRENKNEIVFPSPFGVRVLK